MRGVEVVLGFAIGYYIGVRQGRRGLQETIESAQAIMASPETRRLLSEAINGFESVAGPAMERVSRRSNSGSRAALFGSVVDELIERRARRAA